MNPNNPNSNEEDDRQQQQQRRRKQKRGVGTRLPDAKDVQTTPLSGSSNYSGGDFRAMKLAPREHQLLRAEPTLAKPSSAEMMSVNRNIKPAGLSPQLVSHGGYTETWGPLPQIDDARCIGWDIDRSRAQDFPRYFPMSSVQLEFLQKELPDILTRVSFTLRGSSIQASLCNDPLSAKLQTCENVELYLVFFQERPSRRRASIDPGEKVMYMSVQRHKGDQMIANQYIHGLVDAAKGIAESKPLFTRGEVPNPDALQAVERLMEQVINVTEVQETAASQPPHPFMRQTPEEMAKTAIQDIYGWLEHPKRLDLRRSVLEYLLAMTDLNRTLKSTAIAGSLLVLQGTAPSRSGMEMQAREIQTFFLMILQNRELPGDRAMFEGYAAAEKHDDDIEMCPYFPEEKGSSSNQDELPQYFVEYMNELFHLALQVLVQSLEVVAFFHHELAGKGLNVHQMATELFRDASEVVDSKDLYTVLVGCVGRAESKLSNGYLACKALRLLAMASPGLKERLKMDENARVYISNAYQVGQTCHSLLKDESYQLWETVRE